MDAITIRLAEPDDLDEIVTLSEGIATIDVSQVASDEQYGRHSGSI